MEKEAKKAAEILGIFQIFFEDFPDQRYDTVPFLEIVRAIEGVKNKVKPDAVFTHHFGDLNKDHRITYEAVMTAFRPLPGEAVKEIYSFETPSSTEWGFPKRKNHFVPNFFVDISDTFNKKIRAFNAYKSEMKKYPHPRSPKSVEIVSRRWGTAVGKELVEAFELVREIE